MVDLKPATAVLSDCICSLYTFYKLRTSLLISEHHWSLNRPWWSVKRSWWRHSWWHCTL